MSATNRTEDFNVKVCEEASSCAIRGTCGHGQADAIGCSQGEAAK
jgi:hypothetical protein